MTNEENERRIRLAKAQYTLADIIFKWSQESKLSNGEVMYLMNQFMARLVYDVLVEGKPNKESK